MPNLLLLVVVWPGVATRRQGHLGGDGREDAHSHFTMNLARLRLMPERHKRLQVLESPATLVLAGRGCVVESHTHTGEAQLSIFTRGEEGSRCAGRWGIHSHGLPVHRIASLRAV